MTYPVFLSFALFTFGLSAYAQPSGDSFMNWPSVVGANQPKNFSDRSSGGIARVGQASVVYLNIWHTWFLNPTAGAFDMAQLPRMEGKLTTVHPAGQVKVIANLGDASNPIPGFDQGCGYGLAAGTCANLGNELRFSRIINGTSGGPGQWNLAGINSLNESNFDPAPSLQCQERMAVEVRHGSNNAEGVRFRYFTDPLGGQDFLNFKQDRMSQTGQVINPGDLALDSLQTSGVTQANDFKMSVAVEVPHPLPALPNLCAAPADPSAAPFHSFASGGEYVICNRQQLAATDNRPASEMYILGQNIDMGAQSGVTYTRYVASKLNGSLNGAGFEIKHLIISDSGVTQATSNFGIYGEVTVTGSIEHLKVSHAVVDANSTGIGHQNAGIVAGTFKGFARRLWVARSMVRGNINTGGLFGQLNGQAKDVYYRGGVSGSNTGQNTGGIAGFLGNTFAVPAVLESAYAFTKREGPYVSLVGVTGNSSVGGVVGRTTNTSQMRKVWAVMPVFGNQFVGGVVGSDIGTQAQDVFWLDTYPMPAQLITTTSAVGVPMSQAPNWKTLVGEGTTFRTGGETLSGQKSAQLGGNWFMHPCAEAYRGFIYWTYN